ncbi:EamA family transporter [Nocardioides panacisoli]|uniref:EamA family transporter n=1 Tax=Nocardioides panacisoli TaxID=627624 RepID=UPI001F3DA8B5|nr:EamA family transporter [Nocardioides panacisoli]
MTALAPAVWGTTYLVTTTWLPEGHPLWSGALRALPAGLIAVAVGLTLPRGAWWWKALALGALNIGAFFPLLFLAAYLLPGGVAATLGATGPLLVAAMALTLLAERIDPWRIAWGVVGVAGVAMVVMGPGAALSPLGVAAGVAATASMSLGTVLSKRWGRPVGPVAYTGWLLSAGGLIIVPVAFVVEGSPPVLNGQAMAGYAWLSLVGGLAAYVVWFHGVGRLEAGAVSFLPVISPLVAATLGWMVLEESFGLLQGTGFILAMVAVSAAQRTPARFARVTEPRPSLRTGDARNAP